MVDVGYNKSITIFIHAGADALAHSTRSALITVCLVNHAHAITSGAAIFANVLSIATY
jgi:hypothetical protein